MHVTDKEILRHLKYLSFQVLLCLHDSQLPQNESVDPPLISSIKAIAPLRFAPAML